MSLAFTIVILPYVVSILLKIVSLGLDDRVMAASLEELVSLPKPPGEEFQLRHDQREIIVERLSSASLKTTTILTSIVSLFAAVIIVLGNQAIAKTSWAAWLLLLFLMLGVASISWLLPKRMDFFGGRGWLRLRKGTWATLALCLFDMALAALSVVSAAYPTR
jgi:hypothetical protein